MNLSHGRKITAPEKKYNFSNSQVNNEILFLTGNGVRLLFEVKITTIRLLFYLLTQDQEGRG